MSGEERSCLGVVCPHCLYEHNNHLPDNWEIYDENLTEWECDKCGTSFDVRVRVEYTWISRPANPSTRNREGRE